MLSSGAVYDGLVYAADFNGYLHGLDARTGERHWWHDLKASVSGSPLVVDQKVFVATTDGDVQIFATGKDKRLLARNEVQTGNSTPPVCANGTLYVLTDADLYAVTAPPK